MQQVAPVPDRPICHEVQQQATSVCVTSTRPPGHSSEQTQPAMGGSGCICLPNGSHLGQSGGEAADYPCKKIILIAPGWPSMPWFWDLVAMSSKIPLCQPNLLTQPLNQILHRNLSNLNPHAWLIEPQLSRSRASLRQWQHELRLVRESQPDQSLKKSGPFLCQLTCQSALISCIYVVGHKYIPLCEYHTWIYLNFLNKLFTYFLVSYNIVK